jgi:iron complex transport system substrate-binding protein
MEAGTRQRLVALGAILVVAGGSIGGALALSRARAHAERPAGPPGRIVSLAPSITEILFALAQDEKVVGVTEYCDYPPAAKLKPKIGGYYDPNYEAIVAERPDLVVMLREHADVVGNFDQLGIATIMVSHDSIDGILESIGTIGRACGVDAPAARLRSELAAQLDAIGAAAAGRERPRVLVSVGRSMGTGSIKDVWAASAGTLYDEIVTRAGGVNVLQSANVKYASLSQEGVVTLDPDVIIDMVTDVADMGADIETVRRDWLSMGDLAAIRNGRLYVLGGDYVVVPGPRVVALVEDVARCIHPGAVGGAP